MSILLSRGIVYDHDITDHMDCVILLHFVVFSLLCSKYMCDIYLSIAGFQWIMQVQQDIYLQNYRSHSVDVSQRRNGCVHVYIIKMEGK